MKTIKPFDMLKEDKVDKTHPVHTRKAVRGLIIKQGTCLFLQTVDGDLILPGGGIEGDEPHDQTLRRETVEETGLEARIETFLGRLKKRNPDIYRSDQTYEEISYYYLAQLTGKQGVISLEAYEQDLKMKPVWMSLEAAINHNERLLKTQSHPTEWLKRDLYAMKQIKTQLTT